MGRVTPATPITALHRLVAPPDRCSRRIAIPISTTPGAQITTVGVDQHPLSPTVAVTIPRAAITSSISLALICLLVVVSKQARCCDGHCMSRKQTQAPLHQFLM